MSLTHRAVDVKILFLKLSLLDLLCSRKEWARHFRIRIYVASRNDEFVYISKSSTNSQLPLHWSGTTGDGWCFAAHVKKASRISVNIFDSGKTLDRLTLIRCLGGKELTIRWQENGKQRNIQHKMSGYRTLRHACKVDIPFTGLTPSGLMQGRLV